MQKEAAILKALEKSEISSAASSCSKLPKEEDEDIKSSKNEGITADERLSHNEKGDSRPELPSRQKILAEVISKINRKIKSKKEKQKQLNNVNSAYANFIKDLGSALKRIHRDIKAELTICMGEKRDRGSRTIDCIPDKPIGELESEKTV